jgi:dihydrofolate synthase / folylpolyglutamate synthase
MQLPFFLPFWPDPSTYRNIDLGLHRVYQLLERLGNPHLRLPPTIHLAGTNGKGSTLAFLQAIFEDSGLKVHCYISPHLVRFNERIILAGKEIEDDFLNEILLKCKNAAAIEPKINVTFFEGITVAAFLAFSKVRADILLLETGMGGRLDATNVIENPLATIITPIDFDHTEFLGKTLAKIAFEKAGIIKPNCPVIVAKQKSSALKVIKEVALKWE